MKTSLYKSVLHSRDSECCSQDMKPLACHVYGQTRQIPKYMKGMTIAFSDDCYDRDGQLKLIPFSCRGVSDYVEQTKGVSLQTIYYIERI